MPETEALLRRLFENMTSGTVICEVANDGSRGSDYIVKAVNAASLKHEGKTESEVVGKSLLELRPRVDEYGVIPVFQQVWKTGDPAAWLASRQYIDNDHVAWYEHHVFRLPGGEIVSIYDDITARKQAEDSLRGSEQLYRQVFESTSDAVFLLDVDPDGRISFVNYNPAGERLVGLSSAEVKGRHPEDVYPPAVAEAMNGSYRRMVEEGRPISYDERLHLESGDVWFATTLIPLEDAEGRIVRVLGVAHDITERKQAELLLSRYQLLSTEARDIMLFVRAADGAIVDANAAAEAALAEIEAGAGRIYDAACCEAVLRLFREQGFTFPDG